MDGAAPLDTLDALGPRLRRARRARDLTMEQVAERSAISQSSLSRLEAGLRQPSLAQLLTLARIYDVAVGELLEEAGARPAAVIDPATAPEQEANGLRFRVVDRQDPGAALSALRVTVPAERAGEGRGERAGAAGGDAVASRRYAHTGDEWLYVLAGRLRLTLGERVHVLDPGMAAHFDAATPHRLDAEDGRDAELLLIAARLPAARPPAETRGRTAREAP
ncbi:helix-turn-helix domain-containing protein [Conexibacter woesei]|uniref:Transcriptional regulator, XRE family n=1 Tax=Conexibacter woesei (strain DSM 14684 / CCUG 47730 / CIP 108061 / JCM 11494 / NBRC 100937 / ID131577) TaxID=469383 RepID=D3F7K1_CONWI|nr:XRE family transcriptional regulator [Conexibacter woesei]ADB50863.1 transcriptional regulator, XRE family [Conexibacter woesei DSM 14684]